jgi:hypothetical protein
MADITREGFLFQWNLSGLPKCQGEWPTFRHDQQHSGNYDRDGTQPYRPTALRAAADDVLAFTAPGDDYGCGTAARYQVATADHPITPLNFAGARRLAGPPRPQEAGTRQRYTLPSRERYVGIRAVDEAGNVGWTADIDFGRAASKPVKHGPCANRVSGGKGPDRLRGTRQGDRLFGRRGNDRMRGFGGRDCMLGGRGNDRASGGTGADRLQGNAGGDRLKGGKGPDRLLGGKGSDVLLAADGRRDVVNCGPGRRDAARVDRRDVLRHCERVRRGRAR